MMRCGIIPDAQTREPARIVFCMMARNRLGRNRSLGRIGATTQLRMPSIASAPTDLICPLCGKAHRVPSLAPGERAHCVRCDTTLAQRAWLGGDASLAFTATGLLLAVPATLLPFVFVSKIGAEHVSYVFTGVRALWDENMRLLAVWILLCGGIVPLLLLCTLAGILVPARWRRPTPATALLMRAARAFEEWAMPEVHILAVLVAFAKLGSLVNVRVGAGFWCYAAMSVCLLIAWRTFDLDHAHHALPTVAHEAAVS